MTSITELLSETVDTLRCCADGCVNFPPGDNEMCNECLDALRERDREADYTNYAKYLEEICESAA